MINGAYYVTQTYSAYYRSIYYVTQTCVVALASGEKEIISEKGIIIIMLLSFLSSLLLPVSLTQRYFRINTAIIQILFLIHTPLIYKMQCTEETMQVAHNTVALHFIPEKNLNNQ